MVSILLVVAVLLVGAYFFMNRGITNEALAPGPDSSLPEGTDSLGALTGEEEAGVLTSPTAAALSTPVAAIAVSISITDSGFEPAQVTVAAGTTVTFVNNGQALHWPASGPHPTHTALPGFDAKKGLATGESYSFAVDNAGVWKFHDHLNPNLFGSVTVQ